MEAPHQPLMQALRMLASTGDPTADSCFGELEDAGGGVRTQAFGHSMQDLGDVGWGCFETV